ncbi:YkyA family protein [Heyndrickxia camelliae]|nr:YkyA family protein [Heyndrickxia camelliae]
MIRFCIICISLCILMAGCQSKPEEKIYQILEETVSKEKGFQSEQSPLAKLESEETHLFEQIMNLGMKDYQKVVKLSDRALLNISERKERMDKEQDSMLSSQKEFMKLKSIISDLQDENLKEEAFRLYSLMEKRYKTHEKLYNAYIKGLDADQKLYELLKQKTVSINDIEAQINSTNKLFSAVMEANKQFNDETKIYNEKKLDFYKHARIKNNS